MSANSPVGLIRGEMDRYVPIQPRQPRLRSVSFANRRGVSSSRAKRRGDADELFVEQHDRSPLGAAAARPLSVYWLHRCPASNASGATATQCFAEMVFRLFGDGPRPLRCILPRKGARPAVPPAPSPGA